MSDTALTTLFYLVIDAVCDRPILVFLGEDPAVHGGPRGEPVHLEVVPPAHRFGRPGRPSLGRPFLGQARDSRNRFREFSSPEDLWEAGFLPVPLYRVCDSWADYYSPWAPAPTQATADAGADTSV
ncbi:MAG: hypothetical protein JWO38_7915 [Gemmataceae bacterium]|nr:hypothetical protein [Gemmataceae bacterium]